MRPAFAVWLTGLPASGKSTVARALLGRLHGRGVAAAVLESDVMRTQLTPFASYGEDERERFYRTFAEIGILLVKMGTPVLLDATANKRAYRAQARERIERFAEVFVDTPLEVCEARDSKGLYRAAREGRASTVPGPQAAYEPPLRPELVVSGAKASADEAAEAIAALLEARGWI